MKYGISRVRKGEITKIGNNRLYVIDNHSEPPIKRSQDDRVKTIVPFELRNKCKALSKKIAPLTDKFETDYEYLELIGSGNFGQVFKAKNRRNGKIWAVKKSRHQFISYKDRKQQEEEIRKWSIITKNSKKIDKIQSHCLELRERLF